ncbi:MAG TPA: HDOD domain-containing protein [Noviherbaspirillum sp.]|nr:HDOD domain-containing protein [Noviherbaspirillum sp.]
MFKKLLERFFPPAPEPVGAEDALSPLTVLVVDPPRPVEMIDVDNLFFPWLLGMGSAVSDDMNDAENRLLRALKREADTDSPATADLVPRIPSVVPMLLRSLRDYHVSNAQLAEQVMHDAVLVAAVLKQVNSSYFRRSSPVKTIEEAIAVIGQNGLRMLVASVAFKPLFNAGLGHFTAVGAPRVWELAESYGIACGFYAKRYQADGFEAFLAGLLQGVGAIVALRVIDQAGGAEPGELRSLAFQASFAHYSRRLARLVGRHWEFPAHAIAAVERAGNGEPLSEVLRLADRISKIRTLVNHGALRPEHAQACLDDEDAAACYQEVTTVQAEREKSAA